MPNVLLKILKNGLLPLLLGCGLFFINIRPYHDWGDDFAQYLQEARNLSGGKPLTLSSHVSNPDFVLLGPEAYPPGFPWLLTVSNRLFDNEIIGGQYLVTIFLILFGWISFLLFLRSRVPWLVSLLLMTTLLYHPWILNQKSQVLSEYPFSFFFLLSVLAVHKKNNLRWFVLGGFAAGLAITIRSAGWVLPIAGLLLAAYNFFQKKEFTKPYLLFSISAALVALFINFFSGFYAARGYSQAVGQIGEGLWPTFLGHLNTYTAEFNAFIEISQNEWHFIMTLIQAFFWVSFFFGLIKTKAPSLVEISLGLYLLLIFIFPFYSGFRFLIPIIPLLILVVARGYQNLFSKRMIAWAVVLLLLNIAYQPFREDIQFQEKRAQPGPQTIEAQQLFIYIKSNLKENDLVLFTKPRALAYYTQKPTSSTRWRISTEEFQKQAKELGANYFLFYTDIEYQALNAFVEKEKDRLSPVFSNQKFVLYKAN